MDYVQRGCYSDIIKEVLHIYTRVSTRAQQQEGSSLEEQEKAGKAYAKKNGFEPHLWAEGGASAFSEDLKGRPALTDLLEQIERGAVRHLYVWNTDRLSRNERTWTIIKFKLYDHGVTLHTSSGTVDPASRQDRLLFGLLQEISSYDNDLRRERSRLGKLNRVRNGGWLGGPPPFGYEVVNKALVLSKEESPWVQKIFDWYAKGKSTVFIKTQLDKSGVQPRRGAGTWSLGSIQAILRNTHPIGFYTFTDKETGETIEVKCPGCIDLSIWTKVEQRRLEFQKRKGQLNATKHAYLLRDFLYCGHCGSPMGARFRPNRTPTQGKDNCYYCPAKERHWKKGAIPKEEKWKRGRLCKMIRSLNRPKTDELVWRQVVEAVSRSHQIKEGIKTEVLRSKFATDEEVKKERSAEENTRARLNKQLQHLYDSMAEVEAEKRTEKMELPLYRRVIKKLQDEKQRLLQEIEQSRIREEQLTNQKQWIDWLAAHKDRITVLEGRSENEKKEYLKGIIDRIDVTLDDKNEHHLVIHFKMPIVGDKLLYADPKKKAQGYRIVDGSTELPVEGVDLRSKGGRPSKKKPAESVAQRA